jgi:hypothetical protein
MIISPDNFRYDTRGYYDPSVEATARAWDRTFSELDEALLARPDRLVLLVGLPGSGKSTWAERNDNERDIFLDATLTRKIERMPLIQLAQRHDVSVEAKVFMTPMLDCMFRNNGRASDRRVPHSVIARMVENMQNDPVTLDEGFDRISAFRHINVKPNA